MAEGTTGSGAASRWARAAVAHVDGLAQGPPLDRSLRVTVNFHPDRVSRGLTVLEHLARDGVYRAEHVLDRATFCFPDSVFEPVAFGTARRCGLLRLADDFDARPLTDALELSEGGVLDDYVEAHVHGPVALATDVEALVLDPAHRGKATEEQAAALGIPVEWHEGRRLAVEELERHPDFRGSHVVEVGRRVARGGFLDAVVVGDAVRAGVEDPQDLKKVWHHVARFGSPVA